MVYSGPLGVHGILWSTMRIMVFSRTLSSWYILEYCKEFRYFLEYFEEFIVYSGVL